MLKWLGAVLLIAGTTGIGFCFKTDMQERIRQLKYMGYIMELMKSDISYYREPLPLVCARLATSVKEPYKHFFEQIYQRMEENAGNTFTLIWKEESKKLTSRMALAGEEKKLWEQFCEYTGYGDSDMQENAIAAQIHEVKRRTEEAEATAASKGKLYTSLGAAGGLLLTIILF